jgi:hypothetical protein
VDETAHTYCSIMRSGFIFILLILLLLLARAAEGEEGGGRKVLVKVRVKEWASAASKVKVWGVHARGVLLISEADAAAHAGAISAAMPYEPHHKLKNSEGTGGTAGTVAHRGLLLRVDAPSPAHLRSVLAILGPEGRAVATRNARISITSRVSPAQIAQISHLPFVLEVHHRPHFVHHSLASQAVELGAGAPGVLAAYGGGGGGGGLIAVGDTGIDVQHCSFFDPAHPVPFATLPVDSAPVAPDTGHAKLRAYFTTCLDSSCSAKTDATDVPSGHGTFTSSQAAGLSGCPAGGPWGGVAPAARIVFFDFGLSSTPDGIDIPSNFESVLATAQANGALAFSASWGSSGYGYDDLEYQIDDYIHSNPAFLFQASAGNSGASASSSPMVGSPAGLKNGIVLGASVLDAQAYGDPRRHLSSAFSPSKIASFTSRGPTADGRVAPLVCTPGVGILAADAGGGAGSFRVTVKTGTSMSAPNFPSVAIRQRLSALTAWPPDQISSASVRAVAVLSGTASSGIVDLSPDHSVLFASPAPTDSRAGFGILEIDPSFWTAPSQWTLVEDSVATGEVDTFCFTGAGTGVSAALAWNDPPGPVLVNQLGIISGPTYDLDAINNHKRLAIPPAGAGGQLRIAVFAPALIVGASPQRYSLLVFSGTGIARAVCTPQVCDVHEPAVPCGVAHGEGAYVCDPATHLLSATCYPTACDPGYSFYGLQCVVSSPTPTPDTCDSHVTGNVWDGTRCVCKIPRLAQCANVALCGDACLPHPQAAFDTGSNTTTTAAPTFGSQPLDISPPAGGYRYWLGISFWILEVMAYVAFLFSPTLRVFVSAETLVFICAFLLFCGALVATDCGAGNPAGTTQVCTTPAHLWGLWLIWLTAVLEAIPFMDAFDTPPAAATPRKGNAFTRGPGPAAGGAPPSDSAPPGSFASWCFCADTDPAFGVVLTLIVLTVFFGSMNLFPPASFFLAVIAVIVLTLIFFPAYGDLSSAVVTGVAFVFLLSVLIAAIVLTDPTVFPVIFSLFILILVWVVLFALVQTFLQGAAKPKGDRDE